MTSIVPSIREQNHHSVWVTDLLLDLANQELNFSDIHIEQDQPIMLRMPTGWVAVSELPPISREEIIDFARSIDPDWRDQICQRSISKAVDLFACRLRINVFSTHGGEVLTIIVRRQPLHPIALTDTGLPMWIRKKAEASKGLILITGQTGAGKTTSLASIVDAINQSRNAHVVTVEDPIEFVHERKRSIFSLKEVGVDTPSFSQGVRDAMRQKPDVLVIGEVRDAETADAMFSAAESGHLVLASFHTNSATGAINKLLSWFPDEVSNRARMLSDALLCVVCQTLVPSIDGSERVLATEVLVNEDRKVSEILCDPTRYSSLHDWMRESKDKVSHTLNSRLVQLVKEKRVSERDAMLFTNNRLEFVTMLGQ